MTSLLQTALMQQGAIGELVPWIALLTFLYIAYETYFRKEARFIELLTTQKVLVPVLLLIGMALTPASVMAVFGILQPLIEGIVQITTAVLAGILVNALIAWVLRNLVGYL